MIIKENVSHALGMSKETETFGDWLKRTRKSRGLSQSDLWRETGISKQYISGLEKNARQPRSNKLMRPGEEKVDKLARALAVPLAEARLAAGYAPPARTGGPTKGQRAAEYVDGLPDDKQDDALLFLQMLYQQYARPIAKVSEKEREKIDETARKVRKKRA